MLQTFKIPEPGPLHLINLHNKPSSKINNSEQVNLSMLSKEKHHSQTKTLKNLQKLKKTKKRTSLNSLGTKKNSKSSKSFNNLNSKNLVPRIGNLQESRDSTHRNKNNLYNNDSKTAHLKLRGTGSIYSNKKDKQYYSLLADSAKRSKNRRKHDVSISNSNQRKLRNLKRDKTSKMMEDYSNKNLSRRNNTPNMRSLLSSDTHNYDVKDNLSLLKTKLIEKQNGKSEKNHSQITSMFTQEKAIIMKRTSDNHSQITKSGDYPLMFKTEMSIKDNKNLENTERDELTPRFLNDSDCNDMIINNSSILKNKFSNFFENEMSSAEKYNDNQESIQRTISKRDPDNIFQDPQVILFPDALLKGFDMRKVYWGKKKKNISEIAEYVSLRNEVLDNLREEYSRIINN